MTSISLFEYAELISKGSNGVTLRDQDATNAKDGEWVKVNTLGHYRLDEMVRGHHYTRVLNVFLMSMIFTMYLPDNKLLGFYFFSVKEPHRQS